MRKVSAVADDRTTLRINRIIYNKPIYNGKYIAIYLSGKNPLDNSGEDFSKGDVLPFDVLDFALSYKLKDSDGLVFMGEPLFQLNAFKSYLSHIRKKTKKTIFVFTGYKYLDIPNQIRRNCDFIIDGEKRMYGKVRGYNFKEMVI